MLKMTSTLKKKCWCTRIETVKAAGNFIYYSPNVFTEQQVTLLGNEAAHPTLMDEHLAPLKSVAELPLSSKGPEFHPSF